jgi:hypothetical protein
MKRPRIALWIRRHGAYRLRGLEVWCRWWCPEWLWRWAVRRVDRWHEDIAGLIHEMHDGEVVPRRTPFSEGHTTLTGKLHR